MQTLNKKVTCRLENDMKNLTNFQQNTRKSQNCDFDEIFLSKVETVCRKFTEELQNRKITKPLCVMTMKNEAKF